MGDDNKEALIKMLEISSKNWQDLASKLEEHATEYGTALATINGKLDSQKPKLFLLSGSFWLAVVPYLIAFILGAWALKTHQCITVADKDYGFCRSIGTETQKNIKK